MNDEYCDYLENRIEKLEETLAATKAKMLGPADVIMHVVGVIFVLFSWKWAVGL